MPAGMGPDPLELALQRELRPSERVLWKGKPLAHVSLAAFGIYLFAIPWTAFALFWTAMAFYGVNEGFDLDESPGGFLAYAFPLFGTPFIAVGIGMLAMPFLPLFWADKLLFAITSERIIKLRLGRKLNSDSLSVAYVRKVGRTEGRDGTGTLKLEFGTSVDSDGDRKIESFEIGKVANVMVAEGRLREAMDYAHRKTARQSVSS